MEPGQPDLDRIEFVDLFEERNEEFGIAGNNSNRPQLVLFSGPDQEHDSDIGGLRDKNMIQRWSSGTKRPIQYTTQDYRNGFIQGNLRTWNEWHRGLNEEFGPPDYSKSY
ncbi:hypothetical protein BST61_g3790 [Cercospora zeina]